MTSFRGVYFRGLPSFSLAHLQRGDGPVGWKGDGERGTLFRSLFFFGGGKNQDGGKLSHSGRFLRLFENAFLSRFSPKLAHAPSHALSQHKNRSQNAFFTRDFHEKYLQHRFESSAKIRQISSRKKSALFGRAAVDKNKHARSTTFRRKSSTFCSIFKTHFSNNRSRKSVFLIFTTQRTLALLHGTTEKMGDAKRK